MDDSIKFSKKDPYLLLVSFDSPLNEEIKIVAAKSGDASTHSSKLIKRLSKTVETTYFKDAEKDHPLKTSSSSAVQLKKKVLIPSRSITQASLHQEHRHLTVL
ncbi:hypothetical protein OE903_21950 [Bacillus sp. B6(2022)]|nr:hypothetical protein [Bacillus sp. B6(2022)]